MSETESNGLRLIRFDQARPYRPSGHRGVINRLLAGLGEGGVSQVSVWHGQVEPGGGAEAHVHEHSLQIYVGMSGELVVSTGDGAEGEALGPGDAILIPAGTAHDLKNNGETVATLLVVSSPALR